MPIEPWFYGSNFGETDCSAIILNAKIQILTSKFFEIRFPEQFRSRFSKSLQKQKYTLFEV